MDAKIAVVPGDGIGRDIVTEARSVLDIIGKRFGHRFSYVETLAGGAALDAVGEPLPAETLKICKESDAVLFGAVGGPEWDDLEGSKRPEQALLGLRAGLGLFANIRPAVLFNQLIDASPLCPEIIRDTLDICVVRELTGGIYFGERGRKEYSTGTTAYDTMVYSETEIRRIAVIAFDIAMKRDRKVTSVDKANILESSRLWRTTVEDVAKKYPEIRLNHMYVDNAAMQLVRDPHQFDVIVTTNLFGDILSDEASMITGSIGMLPSASLGEGSFGMYEPVHGSAPDIAGQDKANPIATILSAAMLLRYTLGLPDEADTVEHAVNTVLDGGYRTGDIMSEGKNLIGTAEMGRLIREAL